MKLGRSLAVAFALVVLSASSGCGGPLKYQLRGTQISPGADAKVVATVDEGHGKTDLEIDATNLAPPDRLIEDGKAFVVWARKDDKAQWQRLGALETDGDGRNAKGKFTTPEIAFDLIISAEKEATAASPSGKTLFEQRVQK
jgi:hypothetical protein